LYGLPAAGLNILYFLPELVYLMIKNKYELQRFLAEEIIPTKKDIFPKDGQKHAVIAVFYMV